MAEYDASSRLSLLDRPRFTALSYEWGDPIKTDQIVVNGITTKVTTNLVSVLRHVEKHYEAWAASEVPDLLPLELTARLPIFRR